jgi:hypothetical protein
MQNTTTSPVIQDGMGIQELEALAIKAADTFRPFLGANGFDLTQYKQFLNTMYHYTGKSGEMIRHAGTLAHTEELKTYFVHMFSEEKAHYILAREDLKELGGDVSEEMPRSVKNFHARWFNLGNTIYPYLGAIYVFENIAKHLQTEGKVFFERLGLNKKQKRWVAIHLEADLVHGEEIIALCSRYFNENPLACLEGGKMMCESWIGVFTDFNNH